MATREEMVSIMKAQLAKPIKCAECGKEFVRTAMSQVRDPECQKAHVRKLKVQWAKNSYDRKTAAKKAENAATVEGERPREPLATVPPEPMKPPAGPALVNCRKCGDYYHDGITGKDSLCDKCNGQPKEALQPASEASESTKSTESIQPAPSSIPSAPSIPSIPSPSGRRRIGLVPITALERAHGQIQALWLEIARLQALVEG